MRQSEWNGAAEPEAPFETWQSAGVVAFGVLDRIKVVGSKPKSEPVDAKPSSREKLDQLELNFGDMPLKEAA